jgi:hypothetical protein
MTTRQRQRQPWQQALRRLQMRRQRDADTIDFDAVRMPPPSPPPTPRVLKSEGRCKQQRHMSGQCPKKIRGNAPSNTWKEHPTN